MRRLVALRPKGPSIAVLPCLLAAVVGGCGSSADQANRDQIRRVVHAFLSEQASGNGPAACAQLTRTGRSELVALVLTAARGVLTVQPSCPRAVDLLRGVVGATLLSSLQQVRIKHIRIHGRAARARVIDPGRIASQSIIFRQVGGTWLIAGLRG